VVKAPSDLAWPAAIPTAETPSAEPQVPDLTDAELAALGADTSVLDRFFVQGVWNPDDDDDEVLDVPDGPVVMQEEVEEAPTAGKGGEQGAPVVVPLAVDVAAPRGDPRVYGDANAEVAAAREATEEIPAARYPTSRFSRRTRGAADYAGGTSSASAGIPSAGGVQVDPGASAGIPSAGAMQADHIDPSSVPLLTPPVTADPSSVLVMGSSELALSAEFLGAQRPQPQQPSPQELSAEFLSAQQDSPAPTRPAKSAPFLKPEPEEGAEPPSLAVAVPPVPDIEAPSPQETADRPAEPEIQPWQIRDADGTVRMRLCGCAVPMSGIGRGVTKL
jgi:hypothetical protein